MRVLGILLLAFCASIAVGAPAFAQSANADFRATMERDREQSRRLAPAERDRAERFSAGVHLGRPAILRRPSWSFERGLATDPANSQPNFYLGDIRERITIGVDVATRTIAL